MSNDVVVVETAAQITILGDVGPRGPQGEIGPQGPQGEVGPPAPTTLIDEYTFTGNGAQTVFTFSDVNAPSAGAILIAIDGVAQAAAAFGYVNSGANLVVTFTEAPPDGAAGTVRVLGYAAPVGVASTAAALGPGADRTKLDGIATGATANSTDATLLARANHTGTQSVSTISDLGVGTITATGATTARTLAGRFADVLTPRDFGAVGDNATDDTAAVQAWIDVLRARTNGGAGYLGPYRYRLTGPIDLYPSVPLKIYGDGKTSQFTIDYSGADSVAIKLTHPTTPATRGQRLVLQDFRIGYGSGVTLAPVAIEHRYASDLKMQRVEISHYRRNTALRLSSLYNCDFEDVVCWGAGEQKVYKQTPGGLTFSITSGTTTLTASAAVFDSGDVGKVLAIDHSRGSQVFTIASYTSTTQVEVAVPAVVTIEAQTGAFEGVRGSMTAAGTALTLNASVLTSADIGRVVYVLGAEAITFPSAGVRPLRATITAVGSGTSCTLSTAATATVDNVYVLFSPGIEIFGEEDGSNDATFYGLHSEAFRGAGLVVKSGINLYFDNLKVHGMNAGPNNDSSLVCGVFANVGGYVSGDFEGVTVNNIGRNIVTGQTSGLHFDKWTGVATDGQPLLAMAGSTTSALTTVGDIVINNQAASATVGAPFTLAGSGKLRGTGAVVAYGSVSAIAEQAVVYAPNGTAALPSVTFDSDTDTGFYRVAANSIGITVAGGVALTVDASRRLLKGHTTALTTSSGITPAVQWVGTFNDGSATMFYNFANDGTTNAMFFAKSRAAVGVQGIVSSGDPLGNFIFEGSDGTQLRRAAQIQVAVDGTPGASDMPGRIVFSTTPDGSATVAERLRIDSAGNIGVNGSSFGSGAKVMFIANAGTVPTANPSGGGILYVESGQLKYRGSSGTVTVLAPA